PLALIHPLHVEVLELLLARVAGPAELDGLKTQIAWVLDFRDVLRPRLDAIAAGLGEGVRPLRPRRLAKVTRRRGAGGERRRDRFGPCLDGDVAEGVLIGRVAVVEKRQSADGV